MSKYIQIYENRIEKSILTFRGQEFTCTMVENEGGGGATSLEKCLDIQLENAFPDDEDIDEICELVNDIECGNMERIESLEQLENFE